MVQPPVHHRHHLRALPIRHVALAALVFVLPWELVQVLAEYEDRTFRSFGTIVTIAPSDVVALAFLIVGGSVLLRNAWAVRAGWAARVLWWLFGFATVAYLFHPTMRGFSQLARVAVAVAVGCEITTLTRERVRSLVAAPLLAALALQGVLAALQVATGGRVGVVGEQNVFTVAGPFIRPSGTVTHPYMLVGLALVAVAVVIAVGVDRRLFVWGTCLALACVPIALSFSRAALVSLMILIPMWLVVARRDEARRTLVGAALVGLVVPALLVSQGWLARADESLTSDAESLTGHRIEITKIAVRIIADHPLFGVGPGNYALASEPQYEDGTLPSPVHDTPLLVTAELGIVAGIGYVVLLVVLAVAAKRRHLAVLALVLAPLGVWLFDTIPWFYPAGVLLFGVQMGVTGHLLTAVGAEAEQELALAGAP